MTINPRLETCNEQNGCPMCFESSRFGPHNQAQVCIIHKNEAELQYHRLKKF